LIYNSDFTSRVLPFIDPSYFSDAVEKILFNEIKDFITKYKSLPTNEALIINLSNNRNINSSELDHVVALIHEIYKFRDEPSDNDWLLENTEKFCQDKAIYNAIMESVNILDGNKTDKAKGEIPKLLSDALSIGFDNNIGHDYIEDSDARYETYHRKEDKIPFDLEMFNKITKGGVSNKTLNIAMAGVGVGKSLFLCHCAASCLYQGYDVLYITLEMSEDKIAERIDANLMNIAINDLLSLSKEDYQKKFGKVKGKTQGRLIIKEYAPTTASSLNFRSLLNDLQLKKKFKPKIIFIDYLNLCLSSRLKQGSNVNSYTYIKAVAEELRGLAVEYNLPVFSATQTTRSGFSSSDPGLDDTSESFGLPATADFMFALVSNDDLEKMNQILVKQLKNRYSDLNYYKRFMVGVEKAKMKLYDIEESAQENITDSGQDIEKKSKFNQLKV
jgi:archaellum biogenesis ATPase FlaH